MCVPINMLVSKMYLLLSNQIYQCFGQKKRFDMFQIARAIEPQNVI
jgi:hypothetical protein